MYLDIKATARVGTDINQAAKEAIDLSAFAKKGVILDFNGVDISVFCTMPPEKVVEIYHSRIRSN